MVHDLIVVGAGPVGSLLASIVAEAGYDVLLCEEHKIVGEPTQCAGLVTERALELAGIGRESILQEISGATLLGPKMEKIHLSSPRKKIYSIDRVLFDQTLAVRAERGGAELRLDTRIKSIEVRKKRCAAHLADGNIEEARYVAGCDGPASITRRAMGIGPPMSMLSGVEVEARTEGCSKEILLRCGRGIAPGFFTWAIPAGDGMVRIGLAVEPSMSKQPAKRYLERILNDPALLGLPGSADSFHVERWIGGGIPLGPPLNASASHMLLAGDAACHVKATSGGGVVMGLRCAGHGARAIMDALDHGKGLESYDHMWKKDVGGELRRDWALHKYYASMDDEKFSWAFNILSRPDIVKRINGLGDIDYPSRLVLPLLLRRPGLLRMVPGLLRGYVWP